MKYLLRTKSGDAIIITKPEYEQLFTESGRPGVKGLWIQRQYFSFDAISTIREYYERATPTIEETQKRLTSGNPEGLTLEQAARRMAKPNRPKILGLMLKGLQEYIDEQGDETFPATIALRDRMQEHLNIALKVIHK